VWGIWHTTRVKRISRPLSNLAAKLLIISPLDILPSKDRIKSFKDLSKVFLREETFLDSTEKSLNIIFKEKIFLDLTNIGKLILIIFKKIVSKKNHYKISKFVFVFDFRTPQT